MARFRFLVCLAVLSLAGCAFDDAADDDQGCPGPSTDITAGDPDSPNGI